MKSFFEKKQDIKKVNKPWGHELWIASDLNNKTYAMKEIFIRTGFKTSFQFHEYKEECNYIISGTGTLLLSEDKIDINKFQKNNYTNEDLKNMINNLKSYELVNCEEPETTPSGFDAILSQVV